uniref:RING-type domain-containing protein n=1 Tax=Romanomermis culicivorax TaxID=13658 RepID=A0A915HTX8_ROMCU
MSSYFEEMNFQPLPDGQGPNQQLELARFLLDQGLVDEVDWEEAFPNGKPPPASTEFINSLPVVDFPGPNKEFVDVHCPICILLYEEDEKICVLPQCKHNFHAKCLTIWLKLTSTCPMCRIFLPTDCEAWENAKKMKNEQEYLKKELEQLHHRMYN